MTPGHKRCFSLLFPAPRLLSNGRPRAHTIDFSCPTVGNHVKSSYVNQASSDSELHRQRLRPLSESLTNMAEAGTKKGDKDSVQQSRGIILPNVANMKQNVSDKVAQVTRVEVTRVEETRVEETRVEETRVEVTRVEVTRVEVTRVEVTRVEVTHVEPISHRASVCSGMYQGTWVFRDSRLTLTEMFGGHMKRFRVKSRG
ncbi:hypothetical protein Btru_016535 [Bulinus truncatus]|nr:hypothetical protein Btru_016535 [Bulinus truncatus]